MWVCQINAIIIVFSLPYEDVPSLGGSTSALEEELVVIKNYVVCTEVL